MDSKKSAAEKAAEQVSEGMVIGLGTGSTAYWAIQELGRRVRQGLRIKAVGTSLHTESLAQEHNIPLVPFEEIKEIDLTIDGADEVDPAGNLIKGGGGALLREKIVAYHTRTYLTVVDETKLVERLGQFPLPVEIVPFAAELTIKKLASLFGPATLRQREGKAFVTDNGNLIVDLLCYPINHPKDLDWQIHAIPGVVETGLFFSEMVTRIYIGHESGEVDVREVR